jgi:hypothetical protein
MSFQQPHHLVTLTTYLTQFYTEIPCKRVAPPGALAHPLFSRYASAPVLPMTYLKVNTYVAYTAYSEEPTEEA